MWPPAAFLAREAKYRSTRQYIVVEHELDAVFSKYADTQGPGLVVGIAQRGKPAYRRAFGCSSVENGSRNTVRTRMRIGSSTKQFTCFAILLLAEDGLLSVDDDIRAHLPELPQYARPVLVRHLMSNSGGVRCYLDLFGILAGMDRAVPAPLPIELQLRQRTVNFASGERLVYCNGGYLLLSLLIERVSGMPLAQFLSTRIFEPLGMQRTVFEPYDTKLLDEVATLHQRHPDQTYRRGTIGAPLTGDGAIISDVDDMLRWLEHMDAPTIGSARTWEMLLSAGSDTEHGYGFGLMHLPYRGIKTIQHGGTVFGGRCQALKVPEHGINIVMMSNASDILPSELTDRVLDVLLDGRLGAPLEPSTAARAQRFTGTYYSVETGDELTIVTKDNRAFVDAETSLLPLYDTPDGGFKTNMLSLGIEVRAADGGSADVVHALELTQGGFRAILHRIDTATERADLAAYAGTYENSDCDAQAVLADGEQPRLSIRSRYGSAEYRLEHLCGDAWYARMEHSWLPVKFRVEFARESGSPMFSISSDRTKRLPFTYSGASAAAR
jgi:CubicO group peptidase (beta-lactamase class C family)